MHFVLLSLNPYCSGQWSRTLKLLKMHFVLLSLNPYCSGQWSRTIITISSSARNSVLILIVVDNGLVPESTYFTLTLQI